MPIATLDHINIAAPWPTLERCRRFYVDVLGLDDGFRPPFRSRGFWLYVGERPLVHLVEGDREVGPTGAFNHFAFACSDLEATLARLRAHGVAFEETIVPATGATQLFLRDPAGVEIELNFAV